MTKTCATKTEEEVGFEKSPKWVRTRFGDEYSADSKRAYLLVPGGIRCYLFPKEDVCMGLLEPSNQRQNSGLLVEALCWNIRSNG